MIEPNSYQLPKIIFNCLHNILQSMHSDLKTVLNTFINFINHLNLYFGWITQSIIYCQISIH